MAVEGAELASDWVGSSADGVSSASGLVWSTSDVPDGGRGSTRRPQKLQKAAVGLGSGLPQFVQNRATIGRTSTSQSIERNVG